MEVDGNRGRYGFKVARFVEAESAADAAARALDLVQASPQLRGARNKHNDPPLCRVVGVDPLPPDEAAPAKQPGFAFYPESFSS